MARLKYKDALAYTIGVAIGDGNLSNPNGRAVRLRITCDTKYPKLIKSIVRNIKIVLPNNKVSIIYRHKNFIDISCYSNQWPKLLGWKVGKKHFQKVTVPKWIMSNINYSKLCLRGLLQTDGCIYTDRIYKMINFTTIIPNLSQDVLKIFYNLGFRPRIYKIKNEKIKNTRYNIRLCKNSKVDELIKKIKFIKN